MSIRPSIMEKTNCQASETTKPMPTHSRNDTALLPMQRRLARRSLPLQPPFLLLSTTLPHTPLQLPNLNIYVPCDAGIE